MLYILDQRFSIGKTGDAGHSPGLVRGGNMASRGKHAARIAVSAIVLATGAVAASATEINGCLVYRERNFSGENLPLGRNARLPLLAGTWDNAVSSVRVPQGCLLVAFKDKEFRGASEAFGPGDYSDMPSGWDDEFSSLQCNCR